MDKFDNLVIPSIDEYMNTFAGDIGNFSFACFETFAYHTSRRLKHSTESLNKVTERLKKSTRELSDFLSEEDAIMNRAEEFLERNRTDKEGGSNDNC